MCRRQLRVFLVLVYVICAQGMACAVNSPPTVVSAAPASGVVAVGAWKTLTCVYSDADGAGDLATCSLLINTSITNAGGAHFIYNNATNRFYMKSGTGAMLGGVVRGTAATIESENAILDCGGTAVTASGGNVTIAWRFRAKPTMAGKLCNLYMLAVDVAGRMTMWIDKGDLGVNAPPTMVSAAPASGMLAVGAWKTLTCVYSDPNGAADLATCSLLINSSVTNAGGTHFIYNRTANRFYMKNNSGAVLGGVVRGTAATVESENAVLDCAATSVTISGNSLTVAWRFRVKPTMTAKRCNLYMSASDAFGAVSPWVDRGDISINAPPTVVSAAPASGVVAVGAWTSLACAYSDPDGATDLTTCSLLINTGVANTGGAHFIYNRTANKLYMKSNSGALLGGVARGTAGTIESENAVLDCAATTATVNGNILTVTWRFRMKPTMTGKACNLYMTDADSLASLGSWVNKGQMSVHSFYGLCYGPFSGIQNPSTGPYPTDADMTADLTVLSPYTKRVRVYSALGCMAGFTALAADQGIESLAGCWVSGNPTMNEQELQALITEASLGHMTSGIVGNEAILRNDLPTADLITLMQRFRTATGLPVSTADTYSTWLNHPELAEAADFIVVHIYAYWDGVSIANAAQYVLQQYDRVRAAYPGKAVIIGETGWPKAGSTRGQAVPSVQNQQKFILDFTRLAQARGIEYYYFEAFDEHWKVTQEGNVGDQWGVNFLHRDERDAMVQVSEFPFVVYDDFTAGASHFVPSGWMGDLEAIGFDPQCTVQPHGGLTCTRIVYVPQPAQRWAAVYWQFPENNWGDLPGYQFSGVQRLTFWARGSAGGERAEFKVGGISSGRAYSDSLACLTTGMVTLSRTWQKYTIPISRSSLDCVISGFCWATNSDNNPTGCTIYIDDVQFE